MTLNWKYIAIGIGVVAVIGGGFLFLNSEFMQVDSCLDSGGVWDEEKKECMYAEGQVEESTVVEQQENAVTKLNKEGIVTAVQNAETKAVGEKIGLAYLGKGYPDSFPSRVDPVIAVFDANDETSVLQTISYEEIEKNYISVNYVYQNEPMFVAREILYNEKLGQFLLTVEVLPYEGGSGQFAEWNFFTFGEDDKTLIAKESVPSRKERDVEDGSMVPWNIKFSPDGTKFVYITGAEAGGCAWVRVPSAVNLTSDEPARIQGNVPPFEPEGELGQPTLNNVESYYYHYNKDANGVTISVQDLEWKDDNTLQGYYTAGLCYPDKESEFFTYDFTVTVE